MNEDPKASGEWPRQSGQYQQPPRGILDDGVKRWLLLIPVAALALSFLGSYAGKAYKEGQADNEIRNLTLEQDRQRDRMNDFVERYTTQRYLDEKVKDLKEDRESSEKRIMERLAEIKRDLH